MQQDETSAEAEPLSNEEMGQVAGGENIIVVVGDPGSPGGADDPDDRESVVS